MKIDISFYVETVVQKIIILSISHKLKHLLRNKSETLIVKKSFNFNKFRFLTIIYKNIKLKIYIKNSLIYSPFY